MNAAPLVPLLSFLVSAATTRSSPREETTGEIVTSTWQSEFARELERAEYSFESVEGEPGVWSAPNRAHELRSRVSADGLELFSRAVRLDGAGAEWKLELSTTSFGRVGDVDALRSAALSVHGNRVELEHGLLREWFENHDTGIEHGWTIETRPEGSERLWIELGFGEDLALRVDRSARGGDLVDPSGAVKLHYRALAAFDARGRELPSLLEPTACGGAIRIDDSDALYPIVVDPVLEGPAWYVESNQADAHLGYCVASAGDVNRDGFDDVIVGAPEYDSGATNSGRALLYYGSSSGPGLVAAWSDWTTQSSSRYGHTVASVGDVNGDGFGDVVAAAPWYDEGGHSENGVAWLYLGSPTGLVYSGWYVQGDHNNANLAHSVASAGDVNGDGYDDVVFGQPGYGVSQSHEGSALLYEGSAAGLESFPAWRAEGNQVQAAFGAGVASAGDINADGFDDVLVGAPWYDAGAQNSGRAWLYLGSAGGLSDIATWSDWPTQADAWYGHTLASAGDVNGDGFADVIVAAPYYDDAQLSDGVVWLYAGSPTGLAYTGWHIHGDHIAAELGRSIAGAGDVNGDGYDDVLIGQPGYQSGEAGEGSASLYLGSPSGLESFPAWTVESDVVFSRFAASVASAGDVNGDGASDVIIGAPYFGNGDSFEGAAFVYLGVGSPGTKYCFATTNSTGAPADISASGTARASEGKLTLRAAPVPNQSGIFFHAANQAQLSFGNGFLCATGGTVRGATISASGNVATYSYDNSDARHSVSAYAGSTRHFQYWFRDPMGGGALFNTSNAISITVFP